VLARASIQHEATSAHRKMRTRIDLLPDRRVDRRACKAIVDPCALPLAESGFAQPKLRRRSIAREALTDVCRGLLRARQRDIIRQLAHCAHLQFSDAQ